MKKRKDIAGEISKLEFQGQQINLPSDLHEVYAGLPNDEKEKIQDFLEKTSTGKNVKPEFINIVENVVSGKLKNTAIRSRSLAVPHSLMTFVNPMF